MHANPPRRRSGITLTEILISIMIMGVGMVSLATLFPLGLLRIRDANRMTRSALLAESAFAELQARNLLSKQLFLSPLTNPFTQGFTPDPWLYDTPGLGLNAFDPSTGNLLGAHATWGNGLPVAYDPLWRASVPNSTYTTSPNNFNGVGYYLNMGTTSEARFGSGLGYVPQDTSGLGGTSMPSAYGLQRLTNFNPLCTPPAAPSNNYPVLYPNTSSLGTPNSTVANLFVSPEDIVFQSKTQAGTAANPTYQSATQVQNLSTVVPDMSLGSMMNDWRYTWMFTGHQADDKGMIFEGEIVVFENRPFAIDVVNNAPFQSMMPTPAMQVAGETVVQAVFGYSPNVDNLGYARGADRTVLLRWMNTMSDPDVRVGGWIADVTYERQNQVSNGSNPRFGGKYPGQRCNWYQVVKKSAAADESAGNGLNQTGFRSMTVWISSPLKAKTQLTSSGYVVNAALVCPYVVNVFPRTIYAH